ncbi:MAG: DUF1206 domain-containing protein [Luteitalea sp.]
MKRLVRVGYAAKGVIYLLIGALALQLAFADGGRLTDSAGAMKTIVAQPFGLALLTVIAIGLLAYAGWEVVGAIWVTGRQATGARARFLRVFGAFKGLGYGAIGWQALQIVLGARQQKSDGAEVYAREAMQLPLGRLALVLVGIGVAIFGVSQVWMAWQSRFADDLAQGHLRREGLGWVLQVGRAGIGARGVLVSVMGIALRRAGFQRRASEAGGMADSLVTLLSQPFGTWLLAVAAAGLVCFGFFQLLHARYARL